jgi:FkbM family methyltransferase
MPLKTPPRLKSVAHRIIPALSHALVKGEVLSVALGNRIEERDFFFSHDPDRTASLHRRMDSVAVSRSYYCERVRVITLDHFLSERDISRVDFLKMDLEGNELAALYGAQNALRLKVIRTISLSLGGRI